MTSIQTDDYVVTSYDIIPYDIQSSAIDFAESMLYHSVWDYVYTMTYDSTQDTYTYKLYMGSGLRSLSAGFDECQVITIVYDVDVTSVNRSGSFSGSESGLVVGIENGGRYDGSVRGSLTSPAMLYTVSQTISYGSTSDVNFEDYTGFLYTSIEGFPHIQRGLNYAEYGQGLLLPGLLCAVAVGLFVQIFRRFG